MRTLNAREQRIAKITTAIVAGAVLYVWLVQPQMDRHDRLTQEVAQLEASLTKMRANMQLKDRIEKQYEGVRDLIRESGSSGQEMARFAKLLSDLYTPLNLKPTSVRPLPDVQEAHYRKYLLRLEVPGTTAEIAQLLASLASTPEPLSVEWIEFLCKDRPGYLTSSLIVSRVVTASETKPVRSSQVQRVQRAAPQGQE